MNGNLGLLPHLTHLLLQLQSHDLQTRERLAQSGELFKGYHPEMEQVHLQNAEQLQRIMQQIGWPGKEQVGEEAEAAALLVVQHAISLPHFQREVLRYLEQVLPQQPHLRPHYAYLYDRVCYHQRLPQRFGTQHDWDEHGQLSPWTLEDPEAVHQLRQQYGLPPLAEQTEELRKESAAYGEQPPADFAARQRELEEWRRSVGWL